MRLNQHGKSHFYSKYLSVLVNRSRFQWVCTMLLPVATAAIVGCKKDYSCIHNTWSVCEQTERESGVLRRATGRDEMILFSEQSSWANWIKIQQESVVILDPSYICIFRFCNQKTGRSTDVNRSLRSFHGFVRDNTVLPVWWRKWQWGFVIAVGMLYRRKHIPTGRWW